MSKASVYDQVKQPTDKRKDLAARIAAGLTTLYSASIRAQLVGYRYGDRQVEISDKGVLGRIEKKASEQALTIILFSNQLLSSALDAIPNDATDAQIVAALDPFFAKTEQYNHDSLVPHLAQWAQQQATFDFVQRNAGDLEWECVPPLTDSTEAQCNCPDAIAASPMSFDEAQGFNMPDHPNCIHTLRPIIPADTIWPTNPWTGEDQIDAEAA